jgi:hypothetical protein
MIIKIIKNFITILSTKRRKNYQQTNNSPIVIVNRKYANWLKGEVLKNEKTFLLYPTIIENEGNTQTQLEKYKKT